MREELYKKISEAIHKKVSEIQYTGLWNNDIEKVKGGAVFALPSVFIEFETIEWQQNGQNVRTGDIAVRLHIVTLCTHVNGYFDDKRDEDLKYLHLINRVNRAVQGLEGENFAPLMLTTSATNHNHEELRESIERFVCRARDLSSMKELKKIKLTENIKVNYTSGKEGIDK